MEVEVSAPRFIYAPLDPNLSATEWFDQAIGAGAFAQQLERHLHRYASVIQENTLIDRMAIEGLALGCLFSAEGDRHPDLDVEVSGGSHDPASNELEILEIELHDVKGGRILFLSLERDEEGLLQMTALFA